MEAWTIRSRHAGGAKKFDQEFRAGAVRIVAETGKPIAAVARDLGALVSGAAGPVADRRTLLAVHRGAALRGGGPWVIGWPRQDCSGGQLGKYSTAKRRDMSEASSVFAEELRRVATTNARQLIALVHSCDIGGAGRPAIALALCADAG